MSTSTASRPIPPARRSTISSPSSSRNGAPRTSSPRVPSSLGNNHHRKPSTKPVPTGASPPKHETRETLVASLKHEVEQKEKLMVQVQDKEQTISALAAENDHFTSALHAAETRLNELYTEQSRTETEMAQRIELSDKLRAQIRELEKEKRDLQRRYNEQTITFEAERQAFYDNEQHLKSRIQSLTQVRKQAVPESLETSVSQDILDATDVAAVEESQQRVPASEAVNPPQVVKQDYDDPENEPAEMTALKLELSTLSTSYTSTQNTLVLLQNQLVDLKRVNNGLQEENESYMILLREKTLNGQYDVMKQMGGESSDSDSDDSVSSERKSGSLHSAGRSTLDPVDEEGEPEEPESLDQQLERSLMESQNMSPPRQSRPGGRSGRKRGKSTSHSPPPEGESLADLPLTGPGLDLAAELGRAENKDIMAGNAVEEHDRSVVNGRGRGAKKGDGRRGYGDDDNGSPTNEYDALQKEIKSLKEANKALSLYASKIVDRIILEEGFEHILAVDYEKKETSKNAKKSPAQKPKPINTSRASSNPTPEIKSMSPFTAVPKLGVPANPTPKSQRRSLSFDWRGFSIFGGEKKPESPNEKLRPLTLRPGSPASGARKLDTEEDEEDRRERERMHATLKLMGIEPQPPPSAPSIQKSFSTPPMSTAAPPRRFPLFGQRANGNSETSSNRSSSSLHGTANVRLGLGIDSTSDLTQDALAHAEAEQSIAQLDAHERVLSAEISKGAGGGFTEILPRSQRRAHRSQGGSGSGGSTVWSAGFDDE
ncbi:hypothetical protein FISHEDRAFT_49222 [Fistulina hepatica ATCC 64428]|uniref:M protein, serotype 2.1 n=1 Tax=Fistulina hepatica ATCC 64428 TaxID=1128425 RepID=A0A0D7A6E8_9AGAR|nr:hypothetical protein FISHEDRAFT_49222 [Fistulina hepatica ATCC 64428]